MRMSRMCYDKSHRCPGWAGGGMRYAKVSRCDNGHVRTRVPYEGLPGEFEVPYAQPWRFGYCDTCDVVTWPSVTRWLDWRWLRSYARHDIPRRVRYRIESWRYR